MLSKWAVFPVTINDLKKKRKKKEGKVLKKKNQNVIKNIIGFYYNEHRQIKV